MGFLLRGRQRRQATAGRYAHIDAMRACAVMLVVVAHAGAGHIVPGGSGVTIFFAISGFIITTLVLKESQRTERFDIGGFYVRRAVKLVPPLLVVLVLPTVIFDLAGGSISWKAVAGQMLFYYNWIKLDEPDVFPGSAVVWSLSIEEQFYIVFAILWLCLVRSRRAVPYLAIVATVSIVASTALRLVIANPSSEAAADRIYYGSDTRADSIAWGILAAIALFKWQKRDGEPSLAQRLSGSDWALFIALLVFLASLVIRDEWFRQTFRYSLQSVTTCVIVLYGFAASESVVWRGFSAICRLRILQIVGLASYSIYLVHFSITKYVLSSAPHMPRALLMLIATLLAVAAGILIYRTVEIPSRAYYDRLRARRTGGQSRTEAPPSVVVAAPTSAGLEPLPPQR